MGQPVDAEQRARLLQVKLGALVAGHTGTSGGTAGGHAGAATLLRDGTGWFLADDDPHRALGPALAWARQQAAATLHVVVDDPGVAGVLARRATAFVDPPTVWSVDGRDLVPAEPAGHPPTGTPPEGVDTLVELLRAAGVEVVVEHGEITGEWRGLEIARIVAVDEGHRLEVGVGRHDREAFTLLHGEVPRADALHAVVEAARQHRDPAVDHHPLARLVPERWLRAVLVADPERVGASHLEAVEPIRPRSSVKDVVPAGALGPAAQGDGWVLAVASVGVDLDLVPEAADLRSRHADREPELVLVLPERDLLPATTALVERLVVPARVVTVPAGWRQLAS